MWTSVNVTLYMYNGSLQVELLQMWCFICQSNDQNTLSNENHKCDAFLALAMILRHTLRIAASVTLHYMSQANQAACCFFLLLKTSSCCHARDPCPNQYHRGQNGVLLNWLYDYEYMWTYLLDVLTCGTVMKGANVDLHAPPASS